MRGILDPNPPPRTAGEWRDLLGGLVEDLSTRVGHPCRATAWRVTDDHPGHASACNCVDIRATLSDILALDACGVVCASVNFGEAAWVCCDLLLFAAGRRIRGPAGMDLVALRYDGVGWSGGWVVDECGEWEAHVDDVRWRTF